jgi:hypothetical protein
MWWFKRDMLTTRYALSEPEGFDWIFTRGINAIDTSAPAKQQALADRA